MEAAVKMTTISLLRNMLDSMKITLHKRRKWNWSSQCIAPTPVISQSTFFGCLTTDAFASICLTDTSELFFIAIFSLKM
jgi:hypothetical protein